MCGVFLCLCLQIKPYPLRWTVVSECVVLVQCCEGIWQIAPPPLHPPLTPFRVFCQLTSFPPPFAYFYQLICVKVHMMGFCWSFKRSHIVQIWFELSLPIMCFWPVSECPRNKQTKQNNNNLIFSHCAASEYLPECMNVMLQRRPTTPPG